MDARLVTFVGCRLLAIYMLVNIVHHLGTTFVVYTTNAPDLTALWDKASVPITHLSVGLLIVACLWFSADWVSKRITNVDLPENVSERWSQADVLSIALCIMGIFIVVMTIPRFTFVLSPLRLGLQQIAEPLISLILGLLLVFGGKRIAGFISKLRHL